MEESGRWKLICKALVQVRIQGLPVLQRSTHHYSQDRSIYFCPPTASQIPETVAITMALGSTEVVKVAFKFVPHRL